MARSHDRETGSQAPASGNQTALEALLNAPAAEGVASPGEWQPDPLSDVLRTVKLTGALFFAVDAAAPWGVDVPRADRIAPLVLPGAQHVVSYDIVLQGAGWVRMAGMDPVRFERGDILVFPHAEPYSLLSAPDQKPEFDFDATTAFLRDMAAGKLPFTVREGGNGPDRTQFVCGYLGCDMRPFNPLLATLPRFIRVKRSCAGEENLLDRLIALTLAESRIRRFGGHAIGLGLSELIFIEVLRRHLETLPEGQRGWLAGLRDPAVARVLGLLHEEPARQWSLDELAREAGLSRAVLAERFTHFVGCPPMRYLTRWRMQVAARQIADRRLNIAAAAHEVGYESEAAFSRAFKRVTGMAPALWRDEVRGTG
jgi:AraC-like DNA-binding protein